MLSNKTGLAEEGGVRVLFQGSHCLETSWTSICLQEVVSLCITSLLPTFLSLIKPSVSQSMSFLSSALPNLATYPTVDGE